MVDNIKKKPEVVKEFNPAKSYFILFVATIITIVVTYILYTQVQQLFKERLQERILSMAATASIIFDVDELNQVKNVKDIEKDAYVNIVNKLRAIRERNVDIKYVYILRKTQDPNFLEFVADADSIDPFAEVDLNADGVIDEMDELNAPGDTYDISEFEKLKNYAFIGPIVDDDLTSDQWGTFLSSSAPIYNDEGEAVEILGIDVEVSDYVRITNLAFVPFAVFILFLVITLLVLTISLVKIWEEHVNVLQELDQQKDEVLSIVSHQLATPVSSIKWYTEMLKDGDLGKITKQQKDHLSSMMGVAENLSDLVSMILDVSRIQLGRMHIEKQQLDLNTFFKEILEIINPKAKEKKIKFEISIPKRLPNAMLDRRYTHMTIENLLSNAVKYTPENGVVSFRVEIRKNILYCEVKDTGVGIPKTDQEKIFGKMFRATNVRNEIDGNGFGLYVAKGAVEAQGGKIWFVSEEGEGTAFFAELPISNKKIKTS